MLLSVPYFSHQMKAIAEATESTLGPIDILVNCAGVMYYTLMKNVHQQEWDRQIDVNCKVSDTLNIFF